MGNFMELLGQAFTVLLPILLAGLLFIISIKKHWLLVLNKPIDFGSGLFGPNKNWRGAFFYIFFGTAFTFPLHQIALDQTWVAPVFKAEPLTLGLAMTSAYVAGELVNSFVKRQLGIASGKQARSKLGRFLQAFFDNADGAISVGIVLNIFFASPADYLYLALVLALLIHASTDLLMVRLKLKKTK
jgi:hypothetical protein